MSLALEDLSLRSLDALTSNLEFKRCLETLELKALRLEEDGFVRSVLCTNKVQGA